MNQMRTWSQNRPGHNRKEVEPFCPLFRSSCIIMDRKNNIFV